MTERRGGTWGWIALAGAVGALAAVLVMATVFAGSRAAASLGDQRARATLRAAVADGSILETRGFVPLIRSSGRWAVAVHRHDCLIFTAVLAAYPDATSATLRTARLGPAAAPLDPRVPENPDCQALGQALDPAGPQPTMAYYDRYPMAQRPIAQVLLTFVPIRTVTTVLGWTTFLSFVAVALVAAARRTWRLAAAALAFALFSGTWHFGAMLYFAPLDLAHAAFLGFAVMATGERPRLAAFAVAGALYGAVIGAFEMLTGGIPVALALIAMATALASPSRPQDWGRRLAVTAVAFCVALAGVFAVKLVAVSFATGTNLLVEHAPALMHRLRGDIAPELSPVVAERMRAVLGIDLAAAARDPVQGPLVLAAIYGYWSGLIGWGSPIIGCLVVVVGFGVLVVASLRAFPSPTASLRLVTVLRACWLAVAVQIVWVLVFWNHALLHGFFMARLLVVPVLCGAVVAVEGLRDRRGAGSVLP
ncbi:hypothetical protein [Rhodoplanes serenus]|uniref:hypothetical protein n=1 Tax=Rhodoplanes serenus TaxID=200615 RepID=UPI000DAB9D52|nr:hypothetical protein [Rhodoplanes serenus]RAI35605.1 hypothetical protein CH340_05585 [Rhodoplanes serenus]